MKKKEEDRDLIKISVRLRKIRSTFGFTQGEFAKELGVSKPTYVRYEAAEMWPKTTILSILFREYDVNLNWLLAGKGNEFVAGVDDGELTVPFDHLELYQLLKCPETKQFLIAEVEKLKRIFKAEIESFLAREKMSA